MMTFYSVAPQGTCTAMQSKMLLVTVISIRKSRISRKKVREAGNLIKFGLNIWCRYVNLDIFTLPQNHAKLFSLLNILWDTLSICSIVNLPDRLDIQATITISVAINKRTS